MRAYFFHTGIIEFKDIVKQLFLWFFYMTGFLRGLNHLANVFFGNFFTFV